MQISEIMSTDIKIASPKQTIQDAARMMADIDAGAIPVGEGDRLVGMITDRDIAVRAVAAGKPPNTLIADVMSREVKYCFDTDNIDAVSTNMADIKLRRLPVLNQQKRLVGVISLADIALSGGPDDAATALSGISEPGGATRNQANDRDATTRFLTPCYRGRSCFCCQQKGHHYEQWQPVTTSGRFSDLTAAR